MHKRLIIFILTAVMALGIFGLTACDNVSLDDYKETKIQALQDYADKKFEINSYGSECLASISAVVNEGKEKIGKAVSVDGVDAAYKAAMDAVDDVAEEEKPSDIIKDGAYFTTENNGDYILIKDNLITINIIIPPSEIGAENILSDTFEFSLVDGMYVGNNARTFLNFKLFGNELIVDISRHGLNKKTVFKKNADIELSDENVIQLEAPQNITINPTGLRWSPIEFIGEIDAASISLNRAGILGAGVEVKRAGENDIGEMKIIDFIPEPNCFFEVYFPDLNLLEGINIVRVSYVGGLFLQDGKIRVSKSSEALYFSITVDAQGKFIIDKI